MTLRQRIARRLRFLADRIDHAGSLVPAGMSFTYEDRVGVRVRHDGLGCPLSYRPADHRRAHDESDTEHVQVDWATATARRVGGGEKPWGFHTCRIAGHQGCTAYECRWAPVESAEETR